MNKKFIILIAAVILAVIAGVVVYFTTTNNNESNNQNNQNNQEQNENNENNESELPGGDQEDGDNVNNEQTGSKIAVVYFSATGTTETVAEYIANATNGDLIEIVPEDEYTSADLNYNNDDCRANREQDDDNARPAIANDINVDDYDVIYLGYPIWWGDAPKIILTFLDNSDLSGKTVIPFCTSGGSGIGTSLNTLKNYNTNTNWIEGRRLSTSQTEVTNWVNSLNY